MRLPGCRSLGERDGDRRPSALHHDVFLADRSALAADTVSIIVMEIVDNAIMLAIPGAMDAGLTDPRFWGSLILALGVAFVATFPVNRWLTGRGTGHALVHALHTKSAPKHSQGHTASELEHVGHREH